MQNRLFATLGAWAMLDDAALRAALADLSEAETRFTAEDLARARTLFAKALETPGGLKIQTIHSFCDALLRRFPLEAGISPRFEELDDRKAQQLIEALHDRMAGQAEDGTDPAFDAAADRVGESTLDELVKSILAKRADFHDGAEAQIWAAFNLPPGTDEAAVVAREVRRLSRSGLTALAATLDHGGVKDQEVAALLRTAAAALGADLAAMALDLHARAFLTAAGAPKKTTSFPSKAAKAADPAAFDAVSAQIDLAADIREARLAAAAADRALALHRFGRALLTAYEAEKSRLGALDYDDLIERTRALLTRSDMAAWALYKLDGGIDHVLVDEAQDTSPAQWEVIRALTEEFHVGESAHDGARTIFVVGDEKQSIYSFQGAEPRAFGEMRAHFNDRLLGAGVHLQKRELKHSFRSASPILSLVDRIFTGTAATGLNSENRPPEHIAFRAHAPGLVELWPFLPKAEAPDDTEWWRPVDTPPADDPRAVLAEAIAHRIDAMIGEPLPDHDTNGWRPTRPGDILVLVRRRDILARGIIRNLKTLGVAVAGQDRLSLTGELAVKDLLALLRVLQEPEDDLSLAAVLRSPLCGLSEDDLYALAHGRGKTPLFEVLRARRADFPDAATLLKDLRDRVDYQRPYELLERALTNHHGRRNLIARLGHEAEDPIDELLTQSLAYETAEPPSLTGFLAWIEAAEDHEIKREMQAGADEVRVMTVHGAKGLESPVVILPDTGPRRANTRGRQVVRLVPDGPAVWGMAKKDAPAPIRAAIEDLDQREEEESRRLLYVALTRAEDRLLIAGAGDEKKVDDSWYGMIRAGFLGGASLSEAPAPEGLAGDMLTLSRVWVPPALAAAEAPPEAPRPAMAEPPAESPRAPAPRRVTVTELAERGAEIPAEATGADRALARLKGDAIHFLLEAPGFPSKAPGFPSDPLELLSAAFPTLPAEAREACLAHAAQTRALPEAKPFFTTETLSEAGLSCTLPDGTRAAGRVDRLRIAEDEITVLDIKSGPPPDAAPEAYLRQMALYRLALQQIFPGRPVRAGLLWTAAPRLDWLAKADLDAAIARVLATETAPGASPP
jgi:ATP-dependent helicase/nuclease subunit A